MKLNRISMKQSRYQRVKASLIEEKAYFDAHKGDSNYLPLSLVYSVRSGMYICIRNTSQSFLQKHYPKFQILYHASRARG